MELGAQLFVGGHTSMKANEATPKGVDKTTRYKWATTDKPGRMAEIDKRELVVDESYQRAIGANDAKVLRIASEWSWAACGAIIVGLRNGLPYVIDGQHRVLAALKRSDIAKLPCIVFESETEKDEATAFLRANRNRKPMTTIQSFNAMITSGDAYAAKAAGMIRQTGRTMSRHSSPTTFAAPGALIECLKNDEDAIRRIWPTIIDACDGAVINNELIQGLFYIETRLAGGMSLSEPRWRGKILKLGAEGICSSINKGRAFYGKGGKGVYAEAIMQELNRKVRRDPLVLE